MERVKKLTIVLPRLTAVKNRLLDEMSPMMYSRAGNLGAIILKNNHLNDSDKTLINIPNRSVTPSPLPPSLFPSLALISFLQHF